MAQGDVVVFQESLALMLDSDWVGAHTMNIALLKTSTTPTASFSTPNLGGFTEATSTSGNYGAGGSALDTIANMVIESAGTMTFDDTGASVTWAQHSSNPPAVRWALIYNAGAASSDAIAYVDLGSSVDMTAGDLKITWHASGIFTIA